MQRKVWLAAFGSFTVACAGFWAYSVAQDRAATLGDVEQQTATTARLLEEHAERAFEAGEHVLSLMAEVGRPRYLRQAGQSESLGYAEQPLRRRARSHQRPEQHVAADPRGRVQNGKASI